MMEATHFNQPVTMWLVTTRGMVPHQGLSVVLCCWQFGTQQGPSWVELGEWKSMLLSSCKLSIPVIMATLPMSPLGNEWPGWLGKNWIGYRQEPSRFTARSLPIGRISFTFVLQECPRMRGCSAVAIHFWAAFAYCPKSSVYQATIFSSSVYWL